MAHRCRRGAVTSSEPTIGLDISKGHLDACSLATGRQARFANSPAGMRELQGWIGTVPPARVVFEATGPCHARLERELAEHPPLVKVNPWQARRFAEASGQRARTDRIDAGLLARMGAAFAFEPDRPQPGYLNELKKLRLVRTGLARNRTAQECRLAQLSLPLARDLARERIAQIRCQIAKLDAAIAGLIERHPDLASITRIAGRNTAPATIRSC